MNFDSISYESDLVTPCGISKSDLPADLLDHMNGLFGREESYDLQTPVYSEPSIVSDMSTMYSAGPSQPPFAQYDEYYPGSYDVSNNTSMMCSSAPMKPSGNLYQAPSYDTFDPQYLPPVDSCNQGVWSPDFLNDTWSSECLLEQLDLEPRLQDTSAPESSSMDQSRLGGPSTDLCTPTRPWDDDSNQSYEDTTSESSSITSQSQSKKSSKPLREMTDEEKYQHIRQLNRKTSLEYRNRCKDKMTKLEEQMKHLEIDNRRLEEKAEKLEALRDQMKDFFYNFVRSKVVNS